MKQNNIKGKSAKDLRQMETKLREELFTMRMQATTGQLKNTADLGKKKRQVARVLGELRSQSLAAEAKEVG